MTTRPHSHSGAKMSLDDAIRWMRTQPEHAAVVRDAYLGPDLEDSAHRFAASGEFVAVRTLLADRISGARVLDLGAGTGIASRAFLQAGAAEVIAIEPDPSELVGRGALLRLSSGQRIRVHPCVAEELSVDSHSIDIVYARQVLHHMPDLPAALRECARVLRPGGTFLACREHVVDNAAQLRRFLEQHPMHRLAGGEHAFSLPAYREAIAGAGLTLTHELGPWDTVINAFPFVATDPELVRYAERALARKLGGAGRILGHLPGVKALTWRWLRRRRPGRMYSFLATKPA